MPNWEDFLPWYESNGAAVRGDAFDHHCGLFFFVGGTFI
jgi:hypothetical protein